MKKGLLLFPLFAMILSSCEFTFNKNNEPTKDIVDDDNDDHEDDGPVKVTSISLNKNSLALFEGESETLTYTISPNNAENKSVVWGTSDGTIASVNNGVVNALNEGTCSISVTTEDGNKTSYCQVTVTKKEPQKNYVTDTFDLNAQGYTTDFSLLSNPIEFKTYSISFTMGTNTYPSNDPKVFKATNKHYEARLYWGTTFTITSSTNILEKITFDLGENDKGNSLTCSKGEMKAGNWEGNAKEITFTIDGTSGYKAIEKFNLIYEGNIEEDDNILVNLGVKSIVEVKQYIADHPVQKNAFGNGVNEKRYVTIKGYALAKIDLIKSSSKYGLDVSEHGKVIMADSTGAIGVATVVNNLGTSLWGKIGDYVCKDTSKYVVTGYISEYLGHPELLVTSFTWDQTLDITLNYETISSETITLTEFYTKAQNVNYNCAGHGYGEIVTIKNLKCFYVEADGQGKRYYNFTDGEKNIRVNAFNLSGATEGKVYDVTGIISLKNLSPIIVAFNIVASTKSTEFNYENAANSLTISQLKNIKGSQDDTTTKYPEVISAYGNFYKTNAYLVAVEENGKLYVGICDTPHTTVLTGKTNAAKQYGVVMTEVNLKQFAYICSNLGKVFSLISSL